MTSNIGNEKMIDRAKHRCRTATAFGANPPRKVKKFNKRGRVSKDKK